jgi:hypothetical protein
MTEAYFGLKWGLQLAGPDSGRVNPRGNAFLEHGAEAEPAKA